MLRVGSELQSSIENCFEILLGASLSLITATRAPRSTLSPIRPELLSRAAAQFAIFEVNWLADKFRERTIVTAYREPKMRGYLQIRFSPAERENFTNSPPSPREHPRPCDVMFGRETGSTADGKFRSHSTSAFNIWNTLRNRNCRRCGSNSLGLGTVN